MNISKMLELELLFENQQTTKKIYFYKTHEGELKIGFVEKIDDIESHLEYIGECEHIYPIFREV